MSKLTLEQAEKLARKSINDTAVHFSDMPGKVIQFISAGKSFIGKPNLKNPEYDIKVLAFINVAAHENYGAGKLFAYLWAAYEKDYYELDELRDLQWRKTHINEGILCTVASIQKTYRADARMPYSIEGKEAA